MAVGQDIQGSRWDRALYWLNVGIVVFLVGMCVTSMIHVSGSPGESKNLPPWALAFAGGVVASWSGLLLIAFRAGRQDVGLKWLREKMVLCIFCALGVALGKIFTNATARLFDPEVTVGKETDFVTSCVSLLVVSAMPLPIFYILQFRRARAPQTQAPNS